MNKRILIVEDEKNIVDILSFNLSKEAYETLEAYDGEAGLQLALEQNPDLILLDLMLPKMNGFDVCRSCAGKTGAHRSSCLPPVKRRPTRFWDWSWGQMTISRSPSPCGSCWPG